MEAKGAGKQKRFTVKEWSWIMYDWANSIYATNIMAAIFPTIFVSIAGDAGDIWWGYGTSISTFLIAILAPLLGAVADYRGMKKKLFTLFMLLGVIAVIFLTAKMGVGLNAGLSVISIVFGIFMDILELLVAFIQAYVFTMLSSVFIGLSRQHSTE